MVSGTNSHGKIGVHGRHIGKYENGHTLPNSESLLQIAKALDVSIDYLLLNGQERESASSKIRDRILLQEFEVGSVPTFLAVGGQFGTPKPLWR